MKFFLAVVLGLVTMGFCSCDSSWGYKTTPVQGVLTCEGRPVPGVALMFTPRPGRGRNSSYPGKTATAITDRSGQFALSTYGDYDGAIIGWHDVCVVRFESSEEEIQITGCELIYPCLEETMAVEVIKGMERLDLKLGE